MKKTVSQIYRLAYILFFIWAAFESAFLSGTGFLHMFSDLAMLVGSLCFFAVLAVFICSVTGKIPTVLLKIKGAVTALALFVLVLSFGIFLTPSASGWILKILLPAMMVLDFLLFDKKGMFRFYDPLFWLLALCLLAFLWSLLSGRGFGLSLLQDFFGGADRFLSTLLTTLLAGALMFMLDKFLAGKGALKPWNLFCYIYRILFLVLTGWALYQIGGGNLLSFLLSLERFAVLSGFLCFLAFFAILIFSLLQFRSLHTSAPFPRLKGAFTLLAAVTVIGYHFFVQGGIPVGAPEKILFYVSPIMAILDWILFDAKGKFRPFDPLWWAAVPALYCVVLLVRKTFFVLYPAFSTYAPELFFCGGIVGLLSLGYAMFLLDICLKHK